MSVLSLSLCGRGLSPHRWSDPQPLPPSGFRRQPASVEHHLGIVAGYLHRLGEPSPGAREIAFGTLEKREEQQPLAGDDALEFEIHPLGQVADAIDGRCVGLDQDLCVGPPEPQAVGGGREELEPGMKIGGGFTGLSSAYHLKKAEPNE